MSATGRGAEKAPSEFYPTPAWCVRRFIERVDLPGGCWLEPAGGDGAIIRAVDRNDVRWEACDVRLEAVRALAAYCAAPVQGSFLRLVPEGVINLARYNVVITNPPFSISLDFARVALGGMKSGATLAMLLRLNWLGTSERSTWLRSNMPDLYVLPNRPSFDGEGTDSIEYAWCVWRAGDTARTSGRICILADTPLEQREPGVAPTAAQRTLF